MKKWLFFFISKSKQVKRLQRLAKLALNCIHIVVVKKLKIYF